MFKGNITQFIILTKNEGMILRTYWEGPRALSVYHSFCAGNTIVRFLHIKETLEIAARMIINDMLKSTA